MKKTIIIWVFVFCCFTALFSENDFCGRTVLVVLEPRLSDTNKPLVDDSFFEGIEFISAEQINLVKNEKASEALKQAGREFKAIYMIILPTEDKAKVLEVVDVLKKINGIESAEPSYFSTPMIVPNDEYWTSRELWTLRNDNIYGINAQDAWITTTGSLNVRVGVIDTGTSDHPDLDANVVSGMNFATPNAWLTDTYPHGTLTAGIIGAVGNNTIGTVGVNWQVGLFTMKITTNTNLIHDYAAVNAIRHARSTWGNTDQISILNYSFGRYGSFHAVLAEINNYPGLFVWSAGNSGDDVDTLINNNSWVNPSNLIAVGAIDSGGRRSIWPNRGSSNYSSSNQHVHIYAPGSDGLSTNNRQSYSEFSGTSMSAPLVTGVAALLLSIKPTLTAEDLKEIMIESGIDTVISIPTHPYIQTVKRLNAYNAVQLAMTEVITSRRNITNPSELTNKHFIVLQGGFLYINVGNALIDSPYGSFTMDGLHAEVLFESCTNPLNRIGTVTATNGGWFSLIDDSKINIIDNSVSISDNDGVIQLWRGSELTLTRTEVNIANNAIFRANIESKVNLLDNSRINIINTATVRMNGSDLFMNNSTIELSGRSYLGFINDSRFRTQNHNEIIGNTAGVWNNNVTPSVPITWGDRIEFDRSSIFNQHTITISSGTGAMWDGLFFNDTHTDLTSPDNSLRIINANISNIRYIRLVNGELTLGASNISNIRQLAAYSDSELRIIGSVYENNQYGILSEHGRRTFLFNSDIRNNGSTGLTVRFSPSLTNSLVNSNINNNIGDGVNLNTAYMLFSYTEVKENLRDGVSSTGSIISEIRGGSRIFNNAIADVYAHHSSFTLFPGSQPDNRVGTSPASLSQSRAFLWASTLNLPPVYATIDLGMLAISTSDPSKFLPSIGSYIIHYPLRGLDREVFYNAIDNIAEEKFEEAFNMFVDLIELAPESDYSVKAVSYIPSLSIALGYDINFTLNYLKSLENNIHLSDIAKEKQALTMMYSNNFNESIYLFHEILKNDLSKEQELLYELYQAYSYFRLSEIKGSILPDVSRYKPSNRNDFEEIYAYTMKQLRPDIDEKKINEISNEYELVASNFPNPFNPETTISFFLPTDENVTIEIFNIRGQKINTLAMDNMIAGHHSVVWNGTNTIGDSVSSGVYLYRIQASTSTFNGRMLLMK